MGMCECTNRNLLSEQNLDPKNTPRGGVNYNDSHYDEPDRDKKQKKEKNKGDNLTKKEIFQKVKEDIGKQGEFLTPNAFNSYIPEKYIQYSIEHPYDEEFQGDYDFIMQLPPFKLPNGSIYHGYWNDKCQMSGPGKIYLVHDKVFVEGLWKDENIYKGRILLPDDTIYEGEIEDNVFQGKGKCYYPDKSVYEGDFENGYRHGKGKYTFPDGSVYIGEVKNDMLNGEGNFQWSKGYEYQGNFKDNTLEGKGMLRKRKYGSSYEGEFYNNLFHGKGVFIWSTGEKYDGKYEFGLKHGKGIYKINNGTEFNGQWSENKAHGSIIINSNNKIYNTFWRNGQMVEFIKEETHDLSEDFRNFKPEEEDLSTEHLPYIDKITNLLNSHTSFRAKEDMINQATKRSEDFV